MANMLAKAACSCLRKPCRRLMSVYVLGDNWTGAMGTGSLDTFVAGHHDDADDGCDDPLLMYDGPVVSAAAGWGHSVLVTDEGRILVSGRAYDFSNLLRLNRLPLFLRLKVVESTRNPDSQITPASVVGNILAWMLGAQSGPEGRWGEAEKNSVLLSHFSLTSWPLPDQYDATKFTKAHASAGLTALLTEDGDLMSFGLNHFGQCGVGDFSNAVWRPERVVGLSGESDQEGIVSPEQEFPVSQVALGLQHGIAVNSEGHVYVWGKGERGQLGINEDSLAFARRVSRFRFQQTTRGQKWDIDPKITRIGAGMNHSVALTDSNVLYVWGKHVKASDKDGGAKDSNVPIAVRGLPDSKKIVDVTCGSHHTAVLVEDGTVYSFGIARDSNEPIVDAVEVVPAGMLDLPCRQFEGHFDRTTIVGSSGEQVLQLQLWKDEFLQQHALFEPTWRDSLSGRVQSVHRGWQHTLIVTDSS